MSSQRIHGFEGNNYAYAGYLLEHLTGELTQCIIQLETYARESCNSLPLAHIHLKKTKGPPTWLERTKSFFEELPKSEPRWAVVRHAAGLENKNDILSIVRYFAT